MNCRAGSIHLIPRPVSVEIKEGHFLVAENTTICASSAEALNEARFLAEALRPAMAFDVPARVCSRDDGDREVTSGSTIRLSLSAAGGGGDAHEEAYLLEVEERTVDIRASSPRGLLYGVQTLLQLLPEDVFRDAKITSGEQREWIVPRVRIEDRPRFRWRGMHLDSGRHFMPKEFVKNFIDLIAMHKMNSFHWHLTEDQGWRIEIEEYPRLTEVGAWRDETVEGHNHNNPRRYDGRRHGGYYTKDDVREIVAYAARRHVDVVPEIDMPGHSQAALAAYPHLGCCPGGGPYSTKKEWGVSEEALCAGNEGTFDFLRDVLTEVMGLFPSKYIHIGGDECRKTRWKGCDRCQSRIKENGLANERELQSYFVRRVETFLNANGRTLVGWDEILEGGIAPNAVVMSWRGTGGGIEAAAAGHDVVFAPTSHTYFDYCQSENRYAEPLAIGGYLPLEAVYDYEPIPEKMESDKIRHVLGAQGQLWTEYMPNPKHVEYMAFPRMSALCEVLWTPKEGKDYSDFLARLRGHLRRLDVLDVNYRKLE
uniref:Beta-hexosaminidase n=1 Tax=Odontella aurita TaxID=265563 RepID=A0A7S4K3H5_9STRA|mmetsp:Transcript_60632/g.179778  ORF Transcript_60632/g.179778 Transcript_60632/m.179778 type:complete len:538 (+) Transcript_60632:170-1783(+)